MTDFHFKNQTKYELHVEAAHNTETHISPPGERAGKNSLISHLLNLKRLIVITSKIFL